MTANNQTNVNTDDLSNQSSLSPVYINSSACLSVLGKGANDIAAFVNAEKLQRLPAPLDCYYQAIPLAPLDENYARIYQLLSDVIEQIIAEQSLTSAQLAYTSLFLGSSSMDIGAINSDTERAIWLTRLDHINLYLIKKFGLHKVDFTFSTACTSSSNALIYATRLVRTGQVKQALVIGCEFYNQLTLKGFSSLELLSEQGLHAFASNRDGMMLGEGVAALLLSNKAEEQSCLAMMEGYSSCDSYSLTTTEEDGSKISEVIEKSLELSELSAKNIQLVKAHGTASVASDQAEANAINRVFSDEIANLVLKPFIGHTLGACGVLEVAILIDLIKHDMMPVPTYAKALYKNKVDNETDIAGSLLTLVNEKISFTQVDYILANHCGFGGNNAAFVLQNRLSNNYQKLKTSEPTPKIAGQFAQVAKVNVDHELTLETKAFRKQVKQITGLEVRRMDAFTLIAVQALYELFEQANVKALKLAECKLGLYGVGEYFSVELLQSLVLSIEENDDIRPLDFISSVGNSANFYLAKQFNITGVNLFTGATPLHQERIKLLTQVDLQQGLIDYGVVVYWQQNEHISRCVASLVTLR